MDPPNGVASSEIEDVPEIPVPDDDDKRMWASMSYVLILIIFGIPLWWKLTEVERSYIPYAVIDRLAQQNLSFPVNISVKMSNLTLANAFTNELASFFENSSLFKANIESAVISKALFFESIDTLESISGLHPRNPGDIHIVEVHSLPQAQKFVLGYNSTIYITHETDSATVYNILQTAFLREALLTECLKAITTPGYSSANPDYLQKVRPIPNYDIVFTVVNPDPATINLEWNVKQAIDQHFLPLIAQLKELSTYRIKSQWLYFLDFNEEPTKLGDRWILNQNQIPHIITPLEKRLGSGMSGDPRIHFVVYATRTQYSPTYFADAAGNQSTAVLSARWGGVQLLNGCDATKRAPHTSRTMATFRRQFRQLIGVGERPVGSFGLPAQLTAWEVDFLRRMRTLEQFTTAKVTLASLAQLLGEIGNIVINNEVAEMVARGVTQAELTLDQVDDLRSALHHSNESFVWSERAFRHPSLLALLYFPDDQKYAVYIPLYLPVMIPVLLSMKKIWMWLMSGYCKKNN